jgi:STAS-like domain of unknown function (DUF4325)
MVIVALDHVPHCYSSDDGTKIANLIRREFDAGRTVTLSFHGVSDVPSSFVNAAIVSLLDRYGAAYLRQNLSMVDASSQTARMIRRCLHGAMELQAA